MVAFGIGLFFLIVRVTALGFLLWIVGLGFLIGPWLSQRFKKEEFSDTKTDLPSWLQIEYQDTVKKDKFIKCPVCKKGKINEETIKRPTLSRILEPINKKVGSMKKNKIQSFLSGTLDKLINQKFHICEGCASRFLKVEDDTYRLLPDGSENHSNFKYFNETFHIYEWNCIVLSGKTFREIVLEKLEKGEIPAQQDINIGVPLKAGEKIFGGEKSNLYEPRAVREFHGGSRGVSMRVAKGVSVRVGNFKGQSESHDELRMIDSGVLIITNKRLIFVGPNRGSNIDLKKLLHFNVTQDGIMVNVETRQKSQLFSVSDPEVWGALIKGAIKQC
jgi:hypothetical protein